MHIEWQRALELVDLDPGEFEAEELAHNRRLTPGIWMLTSIHRRLVLKLLAPGDDSPGSAWDGHWKRGADDPKHWNYWAREGLAYRDRLVDAYRAGGIVAPRLVAVHYADDLIVLLLEHVEGLPGDSWEIPEYAAASRSLGRAHGCLLVDGGAPDNDWLSRSFLRQYSSEKPVDWSCLDSDNAWQQPLVQRNFPPELRSEAVWLHSVRGRLLEIAERLPRVLCHLDFWTKNLIMRTDGTVVLIDWAFAGDGAIGEDVGNLIPDAAFDHFIDAESLPDLEAAVRDAYLSGLCEAGWNGDPRVVDLGICASAVKYDWLTPLMLTSASAKRQVRYGGSEEIDADYRFRERGLALLDNVSRARRAMTLAEELNL